jgi:hypothetical protein
MATPGEVLQHLVANASGTTDDDDSHIKSSASFVIEERRTTVPGRCHREHGMDARQQD